MAYQSHIHRRNHWTDDRSDTDKVQIGRLALSRRGVWLLIAALAVIGLVMTLTAVYTLDRQLTSSNDATSPSKAHETQLVLQPSCSPYGALASCIVTNSLLRPLPPT